MAKIAWVAGASGLVGGHLMTQLAESKDYDKVVAFVRSNSNAEWSKLPNVELWVVNYDSLAVNSSSEQVDDVFCALGSTTKKTPNKNTYHKIDVEYPLAFADLALKHGATFYGLVSAHGASASSPSYYLRMKGELETRLRQKAFKHAAIARPSLLKGEREEFRLLEKTSEHVMSLLPGNYKAIHARDVAASLIRSASASPSTTGAPASSTEILSSKSMQKAFQA